MEKKIRYGTLAVALLLVLGVMVNGAMATTSTVSGAFIFDKTTVTAGDKVNIALLGLDKNGIVDIYGEQQGATIFATVSSQLGTVNDGATSPPTPGSGTSGHFAASVKYVQLLNGNGAVNVSYAQTVSGNDTIQITLQEVYQAEGGGNVYKTISQYTQTIGVSAASSTISTLTITGYDKASGDTPQGDASPTLVNLNPNYTKTTVADDTPAKMTAGKAGAQFTVEANNNTATGTVTLTLYPASGYSVKGNKAKTTYTFTGNMVEGKAVITFDGSVTEAGVYYVKAEMDGKSTVNSFYKDMLTVCPKTAVDKLALASNKSVIGNVASDTAGATISIYLLDAYGNKTTIDNANAFDVTLTDANGIVADQVKTVTGPTSPTTLDVKFGHGLNSGKTGSTSITAKPSSSTSSVKTSDALVFKVVNQVLNAVTAFSTPQTAGTSFTAFNMKYYDANGAQLTTGLSSKTMVIKHYVNGSLLETATSNLPASSGATVPLEALFKSSPASTPTSDSFLIGDKDGLFGEYLVSDPLGAGTSSIVPASAASGKLVNGHGETISTLGVSASGSNYVATVYTDNVRLLDAYGNNLTQTAAIGTLTVDTPNGTTTYPASPVYPYSGGTPSMENYAQITYDPTKFVGTDSSIAIKYSKAGVEDTALSATVPKKATLDSILMSISNTKLPLNAKVPLCLDALDANGKRVDDSTVVMNLSGSVLPTIKQLTSSGSAFTPIASGQLVKFDSTSTGVKGRNVLEITVPNKTGDFTITLQNAAGTVKSEKQFTVQAYAEQTKTVGDQPGKQEADVGSTEKLNLVVNTTNTYGDTPAYQWFAFTATASGVQLPVYLLSDKGIVQVTPDLDIYQYTYSYPAGSTVQIAQLKLEDLGLKAGDTFAYAYAYMTADGKFVMDNVVILTIK